MIGDLNVKVGSDAYWQWACTVDHFETDETNERGSSAAWVCPESQVNSRQHPASYLKIKARDLALSQWIDQERDRFHRTAKTFQIKHQ